MEAAGRYQHKETEMCSKSMGRGHQNTVQRRRMPACGDEEYGCSSGRGLEREIELEFPKKFKKSWLPQAPENKQ